MAKVSLFECLGGDATAEAAVDFFDAKIMVNALFKPFFAGIGLDRQHFMQRIFLTEAVGGPHRYGGKSLRVANFAAVAGYLQANLKELKAPAAEIQEVMTITASTHDNVLNP